MRTASLPSLERGRADTAGGGANVGQLSLRIDSRLADDSITGVRPSLPPLYPPTSYPRRTELTTPLSCVRSWILPQAVMTGLADDRPRIPHSTLDRAA